MASLILYSYNNDEFRFHCGQFALKEPASIPTFYSLEDSGDGLSIGAWEGQVGSSYPLGWSGAKSACSSKYGTWICGALEDVPNLCESEGDPIRTTSKMISMQLNANQFSLYTGTSGSGVRFAFDVQASATGVKVYSSGNVIYDAIFYDSYPETGAEYAVEPCFIRFKNYTEHDIPSHYNLGFGTVIEVSGSGSHSPQCAYTFGNILGSADVDTLDPGDEGYEPTGDHPGKTLGGDGHGKRPDYRTDTITQPGEPDESVASITRAKLLNVYDITSANLQKVGECLNGSTIFTFLQAMAVKPIDYIVSLNIFPYTPHIGSSEYVRIGRWQCRDDTTDGLGANANGAPLTQQFRTIDFGTLNITETWASFLDYDHTKAELYLPFIGAVDIDINEIMNGTINVQYTIDYFTGMCVANVLCTKTVAMYSRGIPRVATQYAQHSYQGNCAIQIPLTGGSYGSMVGSLIHGAIDGIKTGNPAVGAVSVLSDFSTGNMAPQVTTKGAISANAGFCSVLYPYIRLTRPITNTPTSYQEVEGYPSYIDSTLGACTGLCVCDNIKLQGVSGATDSEMNRIIQMCKEGVYV